MTETTVHREVAGWAGPPGRNGVECECGVVFDGFDTLAEAGAMLHLHIDNAKPSAKPSAQQALIAGLRQLADWYEQNPNVPLPVLPDFHHCVLAADDATGTAEVEAVAAALGVEVAYGTHVKAGRAVAGVKYEVYYVLRAGAREYARRQEIARAAVLDDPEQEPAEPPADAIQSSGAGFPTAPDPALTFADRRAVGDPSVDHSSHSAQWVDGCPECPSALSTAPDPRPAVDLPLSGGGAGLPTDEEIETPEQSAAIVTANLLRTGLSIREPEDIRPVSPAFQPVQPAPVADPALRGQDGGETDG